MALIKEIKLKILIDGYNLIKRVVGTNSIGERVREQFLQAIGRYAKRKQHAVTVYFDGGDLAYASHEQCYGLQIVYSGYQQTADDMIKQVVRTLRGQAVVLVTSDRELADFARSWGADILGSDEFYEYLRAAGTVQALGSGQATLHKFVSKEPEGRFGLGEQELSLDELMELGSRKLPLKPDFDPPSRKSSGQQLSKSARKLQRKLKKL